MKGARIGGVQRLVGGAVEGNGGAQALTIAPASEEIWVVHWARVWHSDDGGNRLLEWYIDDNVVVSPYKLRDGVTVATGVSQMALGADIAGPLVLEMHGLNLIVQGTGILAGHYLNWTALVEVYASPVGKVRMLPAP